MIEVKHNSVLINPDILKTVSEGVMTTVLENVAQSARNHWIKLGFADSSIHARDYVNGIQEVELSTGEATISLVGEIPHMLEDGTEATDMRDFLLNPEKVDVVERGSGDRGMHLSKKGGFYRTIPIRHSTPTSKGVVGQQMGNPYAGTVENAKKLGQEIHKAAKGLKPGERLAPGTAGAFPLKNITTETQHKTDIYAGLQKIGRGYFTFRTISTDVRDGSWIRKPYTARKYAEKVTKFAGDLVAKAIKAMGAT